MITAIYIDDCCFLLNREGWTRELARWSGNQFGIFLTDEHWELIAIARECWKNRDFQWTPSRILVNAISKHYRQSNRDTFKTIISLFPNATILQRISGIRNPNPYGLLTVDLSWYDKPRVYKWEPAIIAKDGAIPDDVAISQNLKNLAVQRGGDWGYSSLHFA
jgi:TusE/DsrC/DsvC family sulfur relay protein